MFDLMPTPKKMTTAEMIRKTFCISLEADMSKVIYAYDMKESGEFVMIMIPVDQFDQHLADVMYDEDSMNTLHERWDMARPLIPGLQKI